MPLTTAHGDIEITNLGRSAKGHPIGHVRFGGWTVIIDGVGVSVPSQDITEKSIADLQECLSAAYVLADVRISTRAPVYRPELAEALAGTLRVARQLAAAHWRRRFHDVYRCTGQAWDQGGMAVPYTELIKALRAALPAVTTLTEYNDRADSAEEICRLYDRAIAFLQPSAGERGVA